MISSIRNSSLEMLHAITAYMIVPATLVIGAQGCGPTVRSQLPKNTSLPTHIALLPADYSIDIPKERIDLVRQEVIGELRNRNFVVADERVVNSICSSPRCTERDKLGSQHLVEAFATLRLDSFSKRNFLAGYYNTLSGSMSLVDRSGHELITVEHTQSEKGGLLFNSGQLIQGVISQVNSSGDAAYEELASEFAKAVGDELPAPTLAQDARSPEGFSVTISSATAEWDGPSRYSVCLSGTPHSFASVLIGSQRTTLREISPGRYCGAFSGLVATSSKSPAFVELRSAFGNSDRESIALPAQGLCELQDRTIYANDTLALQCAMVGRDLSRLHVGCSEKLPPCKAVKIVLFSAPEEQGPYTKWFESSNATAKVAAPPHNVQVVAIGAGGVSSLPASLTSDKESKKQ
ncbi:MAG: hypothetical protein RL326_149 [Pseudomonadota bacterium]